MSDGNFEGQEVLTEQVSPKVGVEGHPTKIPDQAFELFRDTNLDGRVSDRVPRVYPWVNEVKISLS